MTIVERFQNGMREMDAQEYWQRLEDAGWVDEIPERDRGLVRNRLEEAFGEDPVEAYLVLGFDPYPPEPLEGVEYFEVVVRNFADASHGTFNPVNIEFERTGDGNNVRFGFRHKGKGYEKETGLGAARHAERAAELANRALSDLGADQRFLRLPCISNQNIYTFVSERTFGIAQEKGLIPPEDYLMAYYR